MAESILSLSGVRADIDQYHILHGVGLVQYLSEDNRVAEQARAVADTLCSAKPGSVHHTLALTRPDLDTVAAGLDAEYRHFLEQIITDEADQGMADFLNR